MNIIEAVMSLVFLLLNIYGLTWIGTMFEIALGLKKGDTFSWKWWEARLYWEVSPVTMNIIDAARLAKKGKTLYSKSNEIYLHLDENKRLVFGAHKFSHYIYTDNINFDTLLATDWEVVS